MQSSIQAIVDYLFCILNELLLFQALFFELSFPANGFVTTLLTENLSLLIEGEDILRHSFMLRNVFQSSCWT